MVFVILCINAQRENDLNEIRIQQILEIERQALAVHDAAVKEAEYLPIQAEMEAQALIERARGEAQEEASRMLANAQAEDECARILAQAEDSARRTEALARSNLERAVSYVLTRVIGQE